jgi:ferric-dicitrate binding protein FerR (iron transport regulator)
MTERHDHEMSSSDMDAVALLLRSAGRRADPPVAAYERVLGAATRSWHAKVNRRRRWRASFAIAASLLIVVAFAVFVRSQPPAPAMLAGRTDRVIGTVEIRTTPDAPWMILGDEPQGLVVGSELRTRAGSRAGLVLDGGVSVRLADATDLVLESPTRVQVLSGRVYLDTGGEGTRAQQIEVVTARVVARDVGTQFEVLYHDDVYRLRVREGRVLLSRSSPGLESPPEVDGTAGEQLTIDASGALERTRIAAQDSQWQWVQSVAPAPDVDAQPVTMLLAWVARETGKPVRFASPDVERRASQTILHGNIRHLAPMEALEVMLATTDFEHAVLPDDTILIRLKSKH